MNMEACKLITDDDRKRKIYPENFWKFIKDEVNFLYIKEDKPLTKLYTKINIWGSRKYNYNRTIMNIAYIQLLKEPDGKYLKDNKYHYLIYINKED